MPLSIETPGDHGVNEESPKEGRDERKFRSAAYAGVVRDLLIPAHGAVRDWSRPDVWWPRIDAATAHLPAPVVALSHEALAHNALDIVARSGGMPIRVASKSVRVREVLEAVLRVPGYRGILAFTLAEALWLSQDHDDIVVGYPTADRTAIAALLDDERACRRITLMVDDVAQLDLIDAIRAPGTRPEVRIAIEADASFRAPVLGHVGVRRSPLYTATDAEAFTVEVLRRKGFHLAGLMMYEAQIAGVGDRHGVGDPMIRMMQKLSGDELRERRQAVVSAVSRLAPLEFVNGGGTGSLEYTSADPSVTEVTAGSGFFGGHIFDEYRAFRPAPAVAFALDVVRRPRADIATVLGGGWIASGPPVASRQPLPVWPEGLRTEPREGAGEVQTPLRGDAAAALRVGDRVWFRHAKSGEIAERTSVFHLVEGDSVTAEIPSYRGEGKAFL